MSTNIAPSDSANIAPSDLANVTTNDTTRESTERDMHAMVMDLNRRVDELTTKLTTVIQLLSPVVHQVTENTKSIDRLHTKVEETVQNTAQSIDDHSAKIDKLQTKIASYRAAIHSFSDFCKKLKNRCTFQKATYSPVRHVYAS